MPLVFPLVSFEPPSFFRRFVVGAAFLRLRPPLAASSCVAVFGWPNTLGYPGSYLKLSNGGGARILA